MLRESGLRGCGAAPAVAGVPLAESGTVVAGVLHPARWSRRPPGKRDSNPLPSALLLSGATAVAFSGVPGFSGIRLASPAADAVEPSALLPSGLAASTAISAAVVVVISGLVLVLEIWQRSLSFRRSSASYQHRCTSIYQIDMHRSMPSCPFPWPAQSPAPFPPALALPQSRSRPHLWPHRPARQQPPPPSLARVASPHRTWLAQR
jgi:hypothetical protein